MRGNFSLGIFARPPQNTLEGLLKGLVVGCIASAYTNQKPIKSEKDIQLEASSALLLIFGIMLLGGVIGYIKGCLNNQNNQQNLVRPNVNRP